MSGMVGKVSQAEPGGLKRVGERRWVLQVEEVPDAQCGSWARHSTSGHVRAQPVRAEASWVVGAGCLPMDPVSHLQMANSLCK
jgi:hypothetical protein